MEKEVYNNSNSREDEQCPFCKRFVRQNGGVCGCEESERNNDAIAKQADNHQKNFENEKNKGIIDKKCLKN